MDRLQARTLNELKILLRPQDHPRWRVEVAAERIERFIRGASGGQAVSLFAKRHLNGDER